jgi:predicted nucleotidyltransferase component of viral defense system
MDLTFLEKIKKLAIIAIVSNDELMEKLVLKGGNAIDLIYQASGRASIDLDFSMEREFNKKELSHLGKQIKNSLIETFRQEEMVVFDVDLVEKPKRIAHLYKDFWGGYRIEFKVVPLDIHKRNIDNIESLRRNAIVIGPNQERTFEIEISKFEYCVGKIAKEISGYTVYVYTTEMIILEKIRSICQQTTEYKEIVKTHNPVARARDFFDIYILMENFPLDLNSEKTKELLKAIFAAKKVPLNYIYKITDQREFHRTDFDSVKDTVKSGVILREFDFYFDYVLERLQSIKL